MADFLTEVMIRVTAQLIERLIRHIVRAMQDHTPATA